MKNSINRSKTALKVEAAYLDLPWVLVNNTKLTNPNGPRRLQINSSKTLYNPVLCFKEGDVVFFQVDSATKNFPTY